jgi:hypothetical protein
MRVEVLPFRAGHPSWMRLQPAQAEWRDAAEPAVLNALEADGGAWTLLVDGRVMICGGVIDRGGGRGEAWALVAEDAGRAMAAITRAARGCLDAAPYRRVEAVTARAFRPGGRWARLLGFQSEGVMRGYCAGGGDAERWARLDPRFQDNQSKE